MKKLLFISLLFIFTSSAWATVYKWVDERGVVNFTDNFDKVPLSYRDSVEEVKAPKMPIQAGSPGKTPTKAPPISQTLIREGDLATKLAEALKLGRAQNEAEAESVLTSAGITPRNGWIADYPVTPDIIGELQNAITEAAGSGRLTMKTDEAMKAFQDLIAQENLPVRPDTENRYAETEQPDTGAALPQTYPRDYEPSVINNYYYDQGPPVVTYYPPPRDHDYLYAWVPYPFWCTGFWFPGFFVLRDFHRVVIINRNVRHISNHHWDSRRRGFGTIDPARRHLGNTIANVSRPARGFVSRAERNGASSIVSRSVERTVNRPAVRISGNKGGSGLSNPRGGPGSLRPSTGQRQPSAGYSSGRRAPSGPPPRGSSLSHRGNFGAPGRGTGRLTGPPSGGEGRGFHGRGSGARGFSGGNNRGSSGGNVRGRI